MMTIFGKILFWLVTFVILIVSYVTADGMVEHIRNKVWKVFAGAGAYILIFFMLSLAHICLAAITMIMAYDADQLRTPSENTYVTHELQSITCGDEFNVFISKNKEGENVLQTVVNNEGKLEVIDLNMDQFNFYFTDSENPRIEYYSEVAVEPSMFRWIFKGPDTLQVNLDNINAQYKNMDLKGVVYLPSNMNINQNLIKVCQTH
jgi:hypothetical protein